MKRTTVVVIFFVAAVLAGLFLRYLDVSTVNKGKEPESDNEDGKERFMQREVGMPLEMQAVDGAMGVQGYNGTPPLLGSEPKPTPERPYDMANDNELFQFEGNRISADCCPSPFTSDKGCVCLTDKQLKEFESRGGNRAV